MPVPAHLEFFIDPSRCIGCQACVQACSECDTHKGESMIHLEYVDRASSVQTVPGGLHALRAADLRRGLPRRRDQAHRRRRGAERAQAALHRLRQLRRGVPLRRARALHRPARS
jgi:ferredoxin